MEKKKLNKKQIVSIISWSLVGAVLLAGLILAIISAAMPSSDLGKWFSTYIFDFANFGENFKDKLSMVWRSLLIIAVIYAASKLVRFIFAKIMSKSNRAKTVVNLLDGLIKYISAFAIIFLVLDMFGVNTAALWASAGILTLIIGLGCQSLIADIIAGLFIIFENEYDVNEIIVVDGFRGTVKEIGIRSTKILDSAGDIKIINNSDIKNIVNLSREDSLAICDCGIEYGESIQRVESVIAKNITNIGKDIPGIISGPFYKGVSELGDSSVVVKFIATCKETDRYQVTRDLNRAVKLMFDANNINIPFPQIVLNQPTTFETHVEKEDKEVSKQFNSEQKKLSKDLEEQH